MICNSRILGFETTRIEKEREKMAVIREEGSNSKFVQLLPPIAIDADKDDVTPLDITGFDSAMLTVMVGAANVVPDGTKHLQISLAHSNDNVDFVNCQDDEVVGSQPGLLSTGTFAHLKTAPTNETTFSASYIGDKRYVKPIIKVTGDLGTGIVLGIGAVLYGTRYQPVQKIDY